MRALSLMALLACADGPRSDKSDVTDSGNSHTGDPPIEITYPTGNRILLHYGNGGSTAASTGAAAFDDVEAHLLAIHSWNTDYRDYLPDDLSTYRMIGLIGPGTNDGSNFAPDEVLRLMNALEIGIRVILFADRNDCKTEVAAQLLADMNVDLSYTDEAADYNSIIQTDSFNTAHQAATDIQEVRFKEPCWVNRTGEIIAQDDERNVIMAAERPGSGGEVIVTGDFQFFDDTGYLTWGDNARLIENLAFIQPLD